MTTTTYYDLNIVEGTDIVNPLIVDNPNYEKIDETMHNNAVSGVTLATEIANATVHALNRENSECAVIRFIATSNWRAGDTITIDGVPVTALLPSGETLPDGAYVINANVLCILTGTNLTVYADRKKIDNASEIRYNDTTVANAITDLNVELDNKISFVSANAYDNGTLTNCLLVDLYDKNGINNKPKLLLRGTTENIPSDCSWGTREVFFYSCNEIAKVSYMTLKITGCDVDGKPGLWLNLFNGNDWYGWVRV